MPPRFQYAAGGAQLTRNVDFAEHGGPGHRFCPRSYSRQLDVHLRMPPANRTRFVSSVLSATPGLQPAGTWGDAGGR